MRPISPRCHVDKVSGVTMDLISASACGLSGVAFAALVVGEPEPPRSELLVYHPVLLLKIFDDVALLLVDSVGQRDKNEPDRMPEPNYAPKVAE